MRQTIRNSVLGRNHRPALKRGLAFAAATALLAAFSLQASAQMLGNPSVGPTPADAVPTAPRAAAPQAAPAPQAPQAAAPQQAAPQQAAPRAAAAPAPNLPQVNVTDEQARQKPVQRRAMTQGPNRDPIRIPVNASGCRAARVPGKPYFVEFRSRTAVSYGHTFVFYGRLGEGNSFASYKVAGLHPKGDDPSVYMQGMMVPVPSETGASWGDLDEQYLTAKFCVALSEAEYRRMEAYINQLKATKTTWHATTYNCNAFAADIAKHIGLDSPNPNMYLPENFIKRMAESNPRGKPSNPFAASFGFQGFGQQQEPAAPRRAQRPAPRAQPAAVTQ
ncbi:MAG: hypothetical protein ABW198_03110 [Pseudorhodoplanes sp.]